MRRAFVIGIVGAESSGKTQLAQALQARLAAETLSAAMVSEALREFCDRHRRTPRLDEQAAIAAEQSRRIAAAAAEHAVVVADTTALMTAVYSELVFADRGLYALAEQAHRRCDLTLLTALDLPWQADGVQRDGAHVREPVDALVRAALQRMAQTFVVISGQGDARLQSAWRAVRQALGRRPRDAFDTAPHADFGPPETTGQAPNLPRAEAPEEVGNARWEWRCERCGDAACERHLLLPRG
jgi:nicotinamide riboside kinase